MDDYGRPLRVLGEYGCLGPSPKIRHSFPHLNTPTLCMILAGELAVVSLAGRRYMRGIMRFTIFRITPHILAQSHFPHFSAFPAFYRMISAYLPPSPTAQPPGRYVRRIPPPSGSRFLKGVRAASFLGSLFPSTTMGFYILSYHEVSIETIRSLNIFVPPVTRVCYAPREEEGEGSSRTTCAAPRFDGWVQ